MIVIHLDNDLMQGRRYRAERILGVWRNFVMHDQWGKSDIREQIRIASEVNKEQVEVIKKLVDNQDS